MAAICGLFYEYIKMATDIDVQYFSHLNGLVLGNNWGDLIRLLDKCLVNGLPLTSITSASIDAQGDITLNLYAAHNCMLFQIIELTGFTPNELNGKYRIKGTPSANQLILKAAHKGKAVTTAGTAKLASLGYDIIFRDANDVKRVYRAKNPSAQHPFIRVDESLATDAGVYNSNYARSAMVGTLANIEHIDDFLNPMVQQLPFDLGNLAKNWNIAGTGSSVIRGWSKWYWSTSADAAITTFNETNISSGDKTFTLCGDIDAFYFLNARTTTGFYKMLNGVGLYKPCLETILPNWFLMSTLQNKTAGESNDPTPTPLTNHQAESYFLGNSPTAIRGANHSIFRAIQPGYSSGRANLYGAGDVAPLEMPVYDDTPRLRGTLKHICYSAKSHGNITVTTPLISSNSMYVMDALCPSGNGSGGSIYFYLGELE